jgi:tripartite-type tricarboxylate transporter receptor subunit TctC
MLRSVLVLWLTALATVVPQSRAHSDNWPSRPIRLIVPFVAASSSDTIARLIALKLGEQLGQQIVVENRVGGSTIIGSDAVAKAAPDGYTLGIANTTTHVATAALSPTLPFDVQRDFAPIAMIGSSPFALISSPQTPAATLQEFIALAKAKPGELNYASAGTATLTHLAGELFKWKANVAVAHVPYRGTAQSMFDLMQGRINFMVGTIPPTLPHIREGKLRALATMDAKRNDALPDVPTVAEAGVPGAEAGLWTALVTPSGVPAPVMKRLTAGLLAVLSVDEVQKGLRTHGVDPEPQPPEAVVVRIRDDLVKWRAVVQAAKITGAN